MAGLVTDRCGRAENCGVGSGRGVRSSWQVGGGALCFDSPRDDQLVVLCDRDAGLRIGLGVVAGTSSAASAVDALLRAIGIRSPGYRTSRPGWSLDRRARCWARGCDSRQRRAPYRSRGHGPRSRCASKGARTSRGAQTRRTGAHTYARRPYRRNAGFGRDDTGQSGTGR